MATTVMALGPFRFAVHSGALQRFDRFLPARHLDVPVIGRRPSLHFAGPDVETVHIMALCYPAFLGGRGLAQIEGMRQVALAGTPLMLVAASGRVLGRWVVGAIGDIREFFLLGGTAQRVEVDLELKRYAGGEASGPFSLFG